MATHSISSAGLQRLKNLDAALCVQFNRASRQRACLRLFAAVSRLGDGVFWYALMLVLPLVYGVQALPAVALMGLTGLLCLTLYRWLKSKTSRPRPFAGNELIEMSVAPLDQYSFPSGHTLHAVAFSVVAVFFYPGLLWLLLPFTVLVALSRLVLGLHYPSDVVAGALLGGGLALIMLQLGLTAGALG